MRRIWLLWCLALAVVWAAPPKDFSVSALAWSDDSQTLVSGTAHGELILWTARGQRIRPLTKHVSAIRGVVPHGGEWVTFSADGTVRHSARLDPLTNAGFLSQVVRGGPRVAIFGFKGLQVFDLPTGSVISRVDLTLEETPKYTIDPQGAYLSVQEEHRCVLIDAATGKPVQRIELAKPVVGQAFSPTGNLLVNAGGIYEFSVPKGEPLREYPAGNWQGFRVSSDDHELLVWQSKTATLYPDRDQIAKTLTLPGPASEFTYENRLLIFQGGKINVVTEKNVPYLDFAIPSQYNDIYAISSDGKQMAMGTKNGSVRTFSLYK